MSNETRRRFAQLRFHGDRYKGTAFPVERLPELAAYRDLIVATARALYLDANPHRKKVPKGFEGSFALVLDHVEEGSSVPILSMVVGSALSVGNALPIADRTYFDKARELIEESVRSASLGRGLPPSLPHNLAAKFGIFGRTLEPGETIYLSPPDERRSDAPYDIRVRKEIMLTLRNEYWDDVELTGRIGAVDRITNEFKLLHDHGDPVPFRLSKPSFARNALHDLIKWMDEETPVILRGLARFQRNDDLQELEVDSIAMVEEDLGDTPSTVCSMPVADQLGTLATLGPGWLNGEGHPYAKGMLDKVDALLSTLVSRYGFPVPFLYPTAAGEVRIEWPTPEWEVVVTVDSDASNAWLFATANEGPDEVDSTIKLDQSGIEHLGNVLKGLLKGQRV